MTREIQQGQEATAITVEEVARTTEWWPRLLTSLPADQSERNEIAHQAERMRRPADPTWLMARVAALLTPYYTGDVPHGVRVMEAEDWAESLLEYPQWAITNAVRWWKSDENPKRRQKPVEGDIRARVKSEMGVVTVAERAVAKFDAGKAAFSAPARKTVDKAEAAKIMAAAGFTPRRMGA